MTAAQAVLDVLRDIDDYSQRVVIWSQLESCFAHRQLTADEAESRDDWKVRAPDGELVRFRRKNPNATFDQTLKHFYRDDRVRNMALHSSPFLSLLRRIPADSTEAKMRDEVERLAPPSLTRPVYARGDDLYWRSNNGDEIRLTNGGGE